MEKVSVESRLRYRIHEQSHGWSEWVDEHTTLGDPGKRIEAIQLDVSDHLPGGGNIEYRSHCQGIGWTKWVRSGEVTGTTGESRRLEALQIRMVGSEVLSWNVCYMGYVGHGDKRKLWDFSGDSGPKGPVCNGEILGTTGKKLPLVQISIWFDS